MIRQAVCITYNKLPYFYVFVTIHEKDSFYPLFVFI